MSRAQGIRRALKRADARQAEAAPATRNPVAAAEDSGSGRGLGGASDTASSDEDATAEPAGQARDSARPSSSPLSSLDAPAAAEAEAEADASLAAQVEALVQLLATSSADALPRLRRFRLLLQAADARLAAAEEACPAARKGARKRVLDSEFVVPPFSVWNCAAGEWQAGKHLWGQTGLDDSVGRDKHLFPGRAEGIGGFTIRGSTTSQFCPQLADVVRHVTLLHKALLASLAYVHCAVRHPALTADASSPVTHPGLHGLETALAISARRRWPSQRAARCAAASEDGEERRVLPHSRTLS